MTSSFAGSLDALGQWRHAVEARVSELRRFLADHDLLDETAVERLDALRLQLAHQKLVVAFVAEFSRGKSELINAIFFADAGRRVLPATPGRTTMCPVELGYDKGELAQLSLLPIETRLDGFSMTELREMHRVWTHLPLNPAQPEQLVQALLEVTRTKRVSIDEARTLGLWHDDRPDDNPPIDASGGVEVPAWRHALINYPHPLLERGLVVLDTPGLNAIGAEPELTLGLLPSAHACVFILGADTGVTKSDLAVWREHLGAHGAARWVVLNKIDSLHDPLATADEIEAQIERQHSSTADQLGISRDRVYPLSARDALAARVSGDDQGLVASRLPELERALSDQLLPQRRDVLMQATLDAAHEVESVAGRRTADRRRQIAEQTLELRGLRGKSSAKVRLMLERVEAETQEFEQCTTRLQALRAVHARMLKDLMIGLSSDAIRDEVDRMQRQSGSSWLKLGAKRAFVALFERLRVDLTQAGDRSDEIAQMMSAQFQRLNSDFGFSLALARGPDFDRFQQDLKLIESSYVRYFTLTHALKLTERHFMEQFRRMLISKLRVVFETASGEVEMWNRAASSQIDAQLRDRRHDFRRRHDALERIQSAAGDLEKRLAELEVHEQRLQHEATRCGELLEALRAQVTTGAAINPIDATPTRKQA